MTTPPRLILALAAASLLAVSSAPAQATSNTWDADAAGNWTDVLNWQGDTAYAEGADNTATLGNFIAADRIVTLDAPITIGNITASDTTHNYTLSGANTLTLDRMTGTPTIDVTTSSRTLTIVSDVAGTDGLNKTGGGTLILSGTNNTYSGPTTLAAGTLQGYYGGTSLNPVSPFGASAIVLNGGTLQLIASGSINSTAETVHFGNNVTVGADATVYVNRVGGTASNKTMGLGTLTIGANTLNVTAANVGYSAGFSAVTLTGNATFNPSLTYATLVLGAITQSGGDHSLTKTGVGTLRLTGVNDYAGGTTLNGGTVVVTSNAALGAASSGITVSGSTTLSSTAAASEEYTRAISLGAGATLSLNNGTGNTTATFSGAITGSGHLTVNGGSGFNAVALSSTGNNFTGDLTLNPAVNSSLRVSFNSIGDAGMISLGKNGYYRQVQYSGSSNLVLTNRRLDLNSTFAGVFDGGGVNPINLFENIGTGTITFQQDMTVAAGRTGTFFFGGTNTGDNTHAGVIPNSSGGTLSIAKQGAGKWILGNDNTFSGALTVYAGTLVLGGTNSYTGPTSLSANATLEVANLANGGGDSSIGASSGIPNNLRLSGGTTLRHTGATASTTDRNLALLGSVTIDSSGTGTLTLGQAGVVLSPDYTENASAVWSTANQKKITGLADTSTLAVGMRVTGTGIGANTTITSIDSATQVTVNNNFTATGGGAVNFGYPTARTLTLAGGNTGANTIVGNLQDSTAAGTGVLSLTKTGTGTWVLAGSNTYSGATTISGGTLSINSIASVGGGPSAIGAPTTPAAGTIAIGGTTNTGTLVYTGGAATTDRVINLAGTTGGATLDQSGTGLLKFTSALTATGVGAKTLTLQGSTSGSGELAGAVVNGSGTTSLTKSGTGAWTLSGNNTYTGVTTVGGGLLLLNHASALPANSGLTITGGGVAGLGGGNITRALGTGVTEIQWTGSGGFAAHTADRTVNLGGASDAVTWDSGSFVPDGSTLILGTSTATHTLDFQNPIDLNGAVRTVQVDNGAAGVDARLSGALSNGGLSKTGAGTLELSAANSYGGPTSLSGGALHLTGAAGAIDSSSGVSIGGGATLLLDNTVNHGNRLADAGSVAMTGGTLHFYHPGNDPLGYSETTGSLSFTAGANTIQTSQTVSGASILTFDSLNFTSGTLLFTGTGLGNPDGRNRILFTNAPTLTAGRIGISVTFDDGTNQGFASYDAVNGVILQSLDADIEVRGGVIPNGANIGIIEGGSSGDITLDATTITIETLTQNATSAGTVNLAGGTLQVSGVLIGSGKGGLTFGASVGDGTLMAGSSGGGLTLNNNSANMMTVNSVIANNSTGSTLTKDGAGTVTITAAAIFTGATTINEGTLALVGAGSLASSPSVNLAGAGAVLDVSGVSGGSTSLVALSGVGGSVVALGTAHVGITGTSGSFAGGISGSGNLTLQPGASQTLTGDSTFTGNVTIGTGAVLSVNKIESSGPQPLGQGTTPIIFQGNSIIGSTLEYNGAGAGEISRGLSLTGGQGGTVNVTAGTLTVSGPLSGSASFHKAGAGTLLLSGGSTWNADGFVNDGTLVLGADASPGSNSLSGGNWTVATGATMRLNTTGTLETSTLTRNGTFDLEAGTLRTNTIDGSGAFIWGAGTITPLSNLTEGTVDRTDPGGSPTGPVVREGNILGFNGSVATSNGSVLDLGALYTDNGLRYNQFNVSGALDLLAADELRIGINPYFLRPNTPDSVFFGDWGTLRLVVANAITGTFDSITGIGTDVAGFAAAPGSGGTDTFFDPASLVLNTYYIEYRTSGVLSGAAVLFHYKVAGSVPEPGSAGLLIAGAALIRLLRRRSDNDGSDIFLRRRKMFRRRRSRSRR